MFHNIYKSGLIVLSDITEETKASGKRRDFSNPSSEGLASFNLDSNLQEIGIIAPYWSNMKLENSQVGSSYGMYRKDNYCKQYVNIRSINSVSLPCTECSPRSIL